MAKKSELNLKVSLIITACFALLCGGVYFVKNAGYSKDVMLQKANNFYADERYFMSAKYFSKALTLGAAGPEIYRNYADVLLRLGNYDNAVKYLILSLDDDPHNYETYYSLGNAYYQKARLTNSAEQFEKAAEYLEKAATLSPDTEKTYLLIGSCYRSVGRQEDARSWYRRALLSGNFSQAGFYNLIGHTFREENRFKEALDYYKRAIDADYSFAAAYCNAGDMCVKLNDSDSALAYYQKAVDVNPEFTTSYIKIGMMFADQNKYDEAIPWYFKAVSVNADDPKANYLLGMAYKEIGRKNDAVGFLKKAAYRGSDEAVYELRNMGIDLR